MAGAMLHGSGSPIVGNLLASGSCLHGSSVSVHVHVLWAWSKLLSSLTPLESVWQTAVSYSLQGMSTVEDKDVIIINNN